MRYFFALATLFIRWIVYSVTDDTTPRDDDVVSDVRRVHRAAAASLLPLRVHIYPTTWDERFFSRSSSLNADTHIQCVCVGDMV